MDLNKLKSFIEVADLGSITRAAEKLYRTQSAITQQIQHLEEETELALLERKNAKIYLTKEGEELYRFAKVRIQEITDKLAKIRNDTKLVEGTIRLGIYSERSQYLLPEIISGFKNVYPKVRFHIIHGSDSSIEEALIKNEIDMAFQVFIKEKKFFEIHEVISNELIMVASKEYLGISEKINGFSDLANHKLLDFSEDFIAFTSILKNSSKSTITALMKRKPDIVVDSNEVMRELVLKNMGIAVVPKYLVEPDLKNNKIVKVLENDINSVKIRVHMVLKAKRTFNMAQDRFLKHVMSSRNTL